jgi:hypothetical protein
MASTKIGLDDLLLVSFRQSVTPPALPARVNATARLVLMGAVAAGAVFGGAVRELDGPRAALWLVAGLVSPVWIPIVAAPLRSARSLSDVSGPPLPIDEDSCWLPRGGTVTSP